MWVSWVFLYIKTDTGNMNDLHAIRTQIHTI